MSRPAPKRGRAKLGEGAVHPNDQIKSRYDAAGDGRRLAGWRTPTSGPNLALKGLQNIRNRARDVSRNEWAGRSITRNWVTTLIGIGIRARFNQIKDEKRREQITAWFEQFMNECDADGTSHLFGMQTLVTRGWFDGGEVFVRERPRELSLPLLIPVQFQMLEAEMLPLLDTESWPGLPQGNKISSGIELNRYDRRIAYWFYKQRPNDSMIGIQPSSSDLVRVPAEEVWHIYEPERIGALRGVSNAASVITRLRMSGDYEDAVLDRQRLANLFTMFITKDLPTEAWEGMEMDPLTGLPKAWIGGNGNSVALEPGMGLELRPGEKVQFANPPEAGTMFGEYMRYTHIGTAAGGGLPYELLSGDIKDVSDRTLRVVMNQFYRLAEQRQWQIIIPKFCQKVVDAFAKYAALKGLIRVKEVIEIKACVHAPHAWAYIHPVQDVQADQLQVQSGFKARSDVIQERGYDPEQVDKARAADRKREDALGLNEPTAAQKATQQQRQQQKANDKGAKAREDRIAERRHEEAMASIRSIVAAWGNQPIPQLTVEAPVVNVAPPNVTVTVEPGQPAAVQVDNHLPAPNVQVDNHLPATEVSVTNEIPAPVVNVSPAEVHIENKVETPPVQVELPTRKTTTTIGRNEAGEISSVVQIEKSVD